jgi:hypothetical protein
MVKLIVALVLLAHGIGHIMGPLKVFNVATINPQWQGDSWLLGWAGQSVTNLVGVVVWTTALVGFVALAGVVIGLLPGVWWTPLAIFASVTSLAGLVLFPIAFPTFSTIGAAAVNVALLVAVLWFDWAPTEATA